MVKGLTHEPIVPQKCKVPRQLDGRVQPHQFTTPQERHHQTYLEVLDYTGGEIEERFDQSHLANICDIESPLHDSANGKDVREIPEKVAAYFRDKLDLACLKIQLVMLPDAIRTVYSGTATTMNKLTKVRSITDMYKESDMHL